MASGAEQNPTNADLTNSNHPPHNSFMEVERAYLALAKAIHESPIVPPCTNTDPEIWFGDLEEGYDYSRMAKELCKLCPARKPCAEYAIVAKEQHGIWGGTSPKSRQRIRNPKAA